MSHNGVCANHSGWRKNKEMKMGDVLDETKGTRLEAQAEKEKATEGPPSEGKGNGTNVLIKDFCFRLGFEFLLQNFTFMTCGFIHPDGKQVSC